MYVKGLSGLGFKYIWVVVKIMVPLLGTLNNRCRIILGTIILTTTHMIFMLS